MIMKKTGRAFVRKVIFILTLSAIGATAFAWAQPQTPAAARPNIVLIMSDDMGYADLGSYGASDVKTPNIDSLGRDGVRLTDFYANGVLCSPTRAGLINGRYQQRYLIDNVVGGATPPLKITGESLPQLLKNGGYATGLVGKWHLGTTVQTGPRAHGFEYFFGFLGSPEPVADCTASAAIPILKNSRRFT
jgi:arylsulfatase A-like enzyme